MRDKSAETVAGLMNSAAATELGKSSTTATNFSTR